MGDDSQKNYRPDTGRPGWRVRPKWVASTREFFPGPRL